MEAEGPLNLLDIPDVVFLNHLFHLLRRNDLLRLRRVAKAAKLLAEQHLRVHHVDNPQELEICEDNPDRNLTAFLQMGIPCARVYLNNSSVEWFADPGVAKFIAEYADKITHLRVRNYYGLVGQLERPFYLALTSLKHLTLENVDATPFPCRGPNVGNPPVLTAPTFKQLRTLKFGHVKASRKDDHDYWVEVVLRCCEHLDTIGHPLYDHALPPNYNPLGVPLPPGMDLPMTPMLSNNGEFNCVSEVIRWRKEKHGNKPNLKYYDLGNFLDTQEGGGSFMDFWFFTKKCYEHGVKLENVDSEIYVGMGPTEEPSFKTATYPVVSLKNVNRALFQWELPTLEKVVITKTSVCTYYPFWESNEISIPEWPALKVLDMTVDSTELEELIGLPVGTQAVEQLYEFLFTDVARDNLKELALRFDERASTKMNLPCPRVDYLSKSCWNLRTLTLQNWTGTNKALSKLWGGLRHLEELTLENCKQLGNVAFVGEDKNNPTFLKLTKLKILTLNGLDGMPKVSDTLFSLVLQKMKLRKLFLSSRKPVAHITPVGIKALLSGDFAKSIEKFPFVGWSLKGVSKQEFHELERQFRSYYLV